VPVEPAVPAIDGILDGFNGNPVLLNNLRERIGAPVTKSYLIHTIIQRASALFRSSLSRNEINEINRILYAISAKTSADARRFDFSPIRQLPFLENFSRQVTELENSANRLL
ncbi:hypothetical protein RZS08_00360, partial [Arthrospira platensis SPKY1]|nr:hypothetical protein [Arthrospira platensis SPKY1]